MKEVKERSKGEDSLMLTDMSPAGSTPQMADETQRSVWRYLLWAILAAPALALLGRYLSGHAAYAEAMHTSGEFAARLLVCVLLISPLRRLFPTFRWSAALWRHRRAFGVATCGYTLLHAVVYLAETGALAIWLGDLAQPAYWTAWAGALMFVALAATSNDAAQRRLGMRWWRRLHGLIYTAALLSALHWYMADNALGAVLAHALPIIVLRVLAQWRTHSTPAGAAKP